jgi:uncharacterized protein YyaL (SSP411 family)
VPRRLLALPAVLLAVALAAVALTRAEAGQPRGATPVAASKPATRAAYLRLAERGIADSRAWWDTRGGWYRQRLGGVGGPATNWGIVHLFGATDALALADPTPAHRAAVRAFARGAERYWNPDLRPVPGYGPSPGNRGAAHRTWYDDEGWWGIAFYDAYRATGDRSYLASADRALAFLDSGWDPAGGGIFWDTNRTFKASEGLAAGTLLAAYRYLDTGSPRFLAIARRYISWAGANLRGGDGLYNSRPQGGVAMPYVQGPMAAAFAVLCRATGHRSWCTRAENLADRTVKRFPQLTMGPQYDAMYIRALLELYRFDGNRRWYDVAAAATNRAVAYARTPNGLYLRTWDGRSIRTIGTDPGKLQTHAATTSAAAWMAAAKPPR